MNFEELRTTFGTPDAVSAARFAYVLTCIGLTVALWRASPLETRIKRAAAAAGILHFFASFTADVLLVEADQYTYNLRGLFLGVPLDLHLAWGCLWGAGFCLIWERLRGWKRWAFYAAVVLGTFAWDLAMVSFTGIVAHPDFVLAVQPATPLWGRSALDPWWKWDLTLLSILPLLTVTWFWLVKENRLLGMRALVYAFSYAATFYVLIPGLIVEYAWQQPLKFEFRLSDKEWGFQVPIFHLLFRLYPWQKLLIGLFSIFGAWAAWALYTKGEGTPLPFDPTRKLVTSGPYAYVRNPMQISGVGVALVFAAAFRSWYLAFYVLDLVIILAFTNAWERHELARVFGEPYEKYAACVRNWWPRFKPYRSQSNA